MNFRGLEIAPYRMGAVSTVDLFEPREQELFDLYEMLQRRYFKVLDIGANIGIHSILLGRLSMQVRAYEPDPEHYAQLVKNIERNEFSGEVIPIQAAVSTRDAYAQFVRVLGNTTANHIAGARQHHGPVERLRVSTVNGPRLFEWNDFAKIDCEGAEAMILCATRPDVECEFLIEVGSPDNADAIFEHFRGKREMWTQATGWERVKTVLDMPRNYKEGALFIGERP